jgi:serine/threonine-protein kinase
MGAVLRGRDPILGRHLALKVLLTGRQGDADALRRFHEEAQIGGQLQHPGLVPVYELGSDPSGRPYFAMKLIEGRTLAALLRERKSPSDDLPHFLHIFEQVCQAVGYAHARGVIHRDLKPANIMVGAFGEVQVMDWGLAKVLSQASPERPRPEGATTGGDTVCTERSQSGGSESRAGSVMGTPAYMPPEQARGETERLDARADVFGLGAILCEILTGQPPFTGKDVTEVLGKAARGDLADVLARLVGCGADADLVDLARRCLAPEATDRPADAGTVAAGVAAYRAGVQQRLRTAELERARAETRAMEERRRRRTQLALAGTMLLLLTLGGVVGWWVRQQRLEREADRLRQEAELVRQTENDLGRVALARQEKKWEDAWKALERAEERLATGGPEELRERVRRERRDLEQVRKDQVMIARLEEARLRGAEAGTGTSFDWKGKVRLYRDAFAEYGLDLEGGPPEETAKRIASGDIREPLIAVLDDWWSYREIRDTEFGKRLRRIVTLADDSEWRRGLREAFGRQDWDEVRRLGDAVDPRNLSPAGLEFLACTLEKADSRKRRIEVLQAGQRLHPGDFWLNFELGHALHEAQPPQLAEALRYYTAALALRPENPVLRNSMGNILQEQGKWSEAEALYHEAIRLKPDHALSHNNLGSLYQRRNKLAEAEAEFREAIRIEPTFAPPHSGLGNVFRDQKKFAEAETEYRQSIRLDPARDQPHNGLGNVFLDRNQLDEAEAEFREAIRLKPDSPYGHNGLGVVHSRRKKLSEAEAEYREAIRLQPDYEWPHYNLGFLFTDRNQWAEAEAAFREAIRLRPDWPEAYNSLGNFLWGQGKLPEAEAAYREAIRVKPDFDWGHINLGGVLRLRKKYAEAEKEIREGIRLNPNIGHAYNNLANVCKDQGKLDDAARAYLDAIRVDPNYPWPHCNLGFVYRIQGRFTDSLAAFRRGHELGSRDSTWREPSDRWAEEAERLVELDRRLPVLLRGEETPADPEAFLLLARLCGYKRWHAAAARFHGEAFTVRPTLAPAVSLYARLDAYRRADVRLSARYDAARSAALAGCGLGEDPERPDEQERTRLRGKALSWLRDDLADASKRLEGGKAEECELVRRTLRHWQQDSALAAVRDADALVKLPEAERLEWQKLWQDVEALRQRAEAK